MLFISINIVILKYIIIFHKISFISFCISHLFYLTYFEYFFLIILPYLIQFLIFYHLPLFPFLLIPLLIIKFILVFPYLIQISIISLISPIYVSLLNFHESSPLSFLIPSLISSIYL